MRGCTPCDGRTALTLLPPLFAGAFNDDLFLAHEQYASAAGAQLEEMKPLLRAIEKRDALLADKVEYEAIIADPNRLIKGSSAACVVWLVGGCWCAGAGVVVLADAPPPAGACARRSSSGV